MIFFRAVCLFVFALLGFFGLVQKAAATDLNVRFNKGSLEGTGNGDAPYAIDIFSIDATGDYTWLNYDAERKSVITTGFTQTNILGDFDAERNFGATNFNVDYYIDNFNLGASVGALYASERHDDFTGADGAARTRTEFNTDFGGGKAGIRLGYTFGGFITPYIKGDYEFDFNSDEAKLQSGDTSFSNGNDRFVVGGGFNFNISDIFTGGVDATTVKGEDNVENYTVNAVIKFNF